MKKIILAVLVLLVAVLFAACTSCKNPVTLPSSSISENPSSDAEASESESSASVSSQIQAEVSSEAETSSSSTPSETATPKPTAPAPTAAPTPNAASGLFGTFSVKTLEGDTLTQQVFTKTKLTMINFWATFCGPCINEMPELGEIAAEYEGKDFQILGAVTDAYYDNSLVDTAKNIVSLTGANYTHFIPAGSIAEYMNRNIQNVPTTIFVDSSGKLVGKVYVGSKSKAEWKAIIDSLM